jgi:HK97 family phage portal protein
MQSNWVVFACQTLIASDIGKLCLLFKERVNDVWQETESAYDRLIRKPNGYQTRQQFFEYWSLSKQRHGNAVVLLERDRSTRVKAMHVLDWCRVTPLCTPEGDVYYRLQADDLAGIPAGDVVVPASEIIHDRFNCFFHPLIGLSPLYASFLAAGSGLTMQEQSQLFFNNGSRPGGLLTTPGPLAPELAKTYKAEWETNFAGGNRGRTAVLGNGLKYEAIRENAVDSELVALLKMSGEMICSTHHVPAWKVGVGPYPIQSAADVMQQGYYDNCLQTLLESIESLVDEALELYNVDGRTLRSEFDLNDLIRMDGGKRTLKLKDEVGAGITSPNEARAELGRGPVTGGKTPYLQQQNWPLDVLAERPPPTDPAAKAPAPDEPPKPVDDDAAAEKFIADVIAKAAEDLHAG